jgi:gliding motility-associated-like protein
MRLIQERTLRHIIVILITLNLFQTVYAQTPVFYLKASGANGTTTFSDSGPNHYPVSVTGNPVNDSICDNTAVHINGSSLQPSGNYVFAPSTPDFNLGNSDFTIHFWVYLEDITTTHAAFDLRSFPAEHIFFIHYPGTGWFFGDRQGQATIVQQTTVTMVPHVWTHVALVRSGNNFSIYINGCLAATANWAINISDSNGLTIGYSADNRDQLKGYIDEFYIYKGTALWTGSFTPPGSSIFASCGSTISPFSVSTSSINIKCKGDSTGSISVSATGGIPTYTYQWSGYAAGQNGATVSGLPAGTYIVTVTDQGCSSSRDTITITEPPVLSVNVSAPDTLICLGESAALTAITSGGSPPYSYSWSNSNSNSSQTVTPLNTTNYIVTVTDSNSCSKDTSVRINVNKPIALFTTANVCMNDSTYFSDNSSVNFGSIVSYNWDFGDGNYSSHQNPAHLYLMAGNYTVKLKVISNTDCSDSSTLTITIHPLPQILFSTQNVCIGLSLQFNDLSTIPATDTILSQTWNFGDSSPPATSTSVFHQYSVAGSYPVRLVAKSFFGCSDSTTKTTVVNPVLSVNISTLDTLVCSGESTTLAAIVSGGSPPYSFSWSNSNSNPLQTVTPMSATNYTVTVTDSNSCSKDTSVRINVNKPISLFTTSNVCMNDSAYFLENSSVNFGSIVSYNWNFGDGSNSLHQNPAHLYSIAGNYHVKIKITSNSSCSDSSAVTITIHPLPHILFSSQNVCLGATSQFTDLSTIPTTDTIQSQTWNLGDGSPLATNQSVSHQYSGMGSYVVQLVAVSSFGCSDSLTKITFVNPNPSVHFTASDTVGCKPLCVSFQNTSTIASGANASFFWNLGDGSPVSSLQDLLHCYTNDSVYSAVSYSPTLTVTSDSGCIKTVSKNNYITVYPSPNAIFRIQPQVATITDPVISITDLSTGANFWHWNFGDTATSIIANPLSHTYADTGTYVITLITSTQYNCADTARETVIIEPDFIFYIPNAFTPNDDGVNDTFIGKGVFIKQLEMSIFDRWGNLIYQTNDINKPWDGKANHGSNIAQQDVYIYSIKVTDFKNIKHNYRGIVTLVK